MVAFGVESGRGDRREDERGERAEGHAGLEERSRIPPRLHNTEGDELVFVTDRFDLDPAARAEIEARLAAMPGVVAPDEGDADRDYVVHPEGAAQRPDREDLVIGHATVGECALTVETNSLRRADALRRRIEAALGALVRHRRRGRRDARREARARGDLSDLPEASQMVREMKERHYADWADRPLPALGGKTARQAVRSARGRERVDALLKNIEYGDAAARRALRRVRPAPLARPVTTECRAPTAEWSAVPEEGALYLVA